MALSPDSAAFRVTSAPRASREVVADGASSGTAADPIEIADTGSRFLGEVSLSPDGRTALVTNHGGLEVIAIDTETMSTRRLQLAAPPSGVSVTADGLGVVAQSSFKNSGVAVIDLATMTLVETYEFTTGEILGSNQIVALAGC